MWGRQTSGYVSVIDSIFRAHKYQGEKNEAEAIRACMELGEFYI